MDFGWPMMLWGLVALPLLAWGYAWMGRRQRTVQQRLADLHLLPALFRPAAAWRRHLPMACYFLAVLFLVVAMARPSAAIPLPVNRAALVIAIDTSGSMMAEDVKPTRLEAAREAARTLVRAIPGSTLVGLVAFSDYGTVLVPPTTDRQAFEEALRELRPRQATAVGSAIAEALRVLPLRERFLGDRLRQLRGPGPQSAPGAPGAPGPFGVPAPGAPAPGAPGPAPTPSGPPPDVSELPPAAIVIFSDGVSNLGADPRAAAALASEARVKIFAVGMGQPGGTVMTHQGRLVFVPFDPTLLQQVAQATGGEYFAATDREALRRIARQLGRSIGWERRRTEITSLLSGTAGALMLAGGLLSLWWFRRLP
ncbi:MAG: VWA domain-containing protein [Armatimonadota bacterium]|nr:VWA domain-containing protein [Armatimonadota bacterium]MDR7449417.1 VWA domain-containing protein [Armatimonadota bacterium]MDR7459830.1 VWA domain-containing protein [Armatimonadota bacterium]MDR7480241.1 VWA domain-containing protein [Armatimonadota bacterium]MDR7492298.1 VWA domain-containing protein [Armatimonadota bacterium]